MKSSVIQVSHSCKVEYSFTHARIWIIHDLNFPLNQYHYRLEQKSQHFFGTRIHDLIAYLHQKQGFWPSSFSIKQKPSSNGVVAEGTLPCITSKVQNKNCDMIGSSFTTSLNLSLTLVSDSPTSLRSWASFTSNTIGVRPGFAAAVGTMVFTYLVFMCTYMNNWEMRFLPLKEQSAIK